MQFKRSDMSEPVMLTVVLKKCTKEANVENDQPIYICVEEELLKCKMVCWIQGLTRGMCD